MMSKCERVSEWMDEGGGASSVKRKDGAGWAKQQSQRGTGAGFKF